MLSLPYDSLHERKIQGTAIAVLNWLGSPQTALTSTIFNFRQIRDAHRRANKHADNHPALWTQVYYVSSCFNQFAISHGKAKSELYETLIYGLLHPLIGAENDLSTQLTDHLLSALTKQLRTLRRRAVMPTLASLGTFLMAFIFSVVLSFAEVGEHTKVDFLVLGLLYAWLPVLVIFTIVDRNPVSSDRTR